MPNFLSDGGAPLFIQPGTPDNFALDFDGSTEVLANITEQPIGIANVWTIAQWIKVDELNGDRRFIQINQDQTLPGGSANRILIHHGALDHLRVFINSSVPGVIKHYNWTPSPLVVDEWKHLVVTWNGTLLKLYVDGSERTPSDKFVDNAGTMTDSNRRVHIGAGADGSDNDYEDNFFKGDLHSTAILNVALDQANITQIFGNRAESDLRYNFQHYNQAAALQHYYRHGFNSGDIGEDLGNASTLIDVGDNAVGITAADIVEDSP